MVVVHGQDKRKRDNRDSFATLVSASRKRYFTLIRAEKRASELASDSIIPEARILRLMNFVGCAEYRFLRAAYTTLSQGLTF